MHRVRFVAGFVLAGLLALAVCGPAGAKVYIDITSPSARKFPIAVEDFTGADQSGPVTSVVRADLDFSGLFRFVGGEGERGDAPFWLSAGAEALIRGSVAVKGEELVLEAYLIDIVRGETLLAKRYRGNRRDWRKISHRFADDVMAALTGERGVFETAIAFVSNKGGNKEIYVMDYDGERARKITANGSINLTPRWSPDGKRILFTSFKEGKAAIFLKNVTDYGERRLVSRSYQHMGGAWSPDGKRVVFTVSREGDSDLFMAETNGDGGPLKRLTSGWGLDVSPAWSPDGKSIAFVSDRGGNPNIYRVTEDGRDLTRLTFEGKYNTSPAWSPDGKLIAYSSLQKGGFRIYIMDADGAGKRQVTFGPGDDEEPSWSPDGRYIVFSSTRGGRKGLYVLNPDDGRIVKLKGTGGDDMSPAWSPYFRK